jgi:hypothetical protein
VHKHAATDKTSIATNSLFFIDSLLLSAGFSVPQNGPGSVALANGRRFGNDSREAIGNKGTERNMK